MSSDVPDQARDFITKRRKRLSTLVEVSNENRGFIESENPKPIGLAFSGGGIRSATISLGLTQLLVRRNRFSAFDYVSTASGGGYFGSFLRSLFLPQSAKGRQSSEEDKIPDHEIGEQFFFAHSVLGAGPRKGDVPGSLPSDCDVGESEEAPKGERNPIWWLRENGRYLAPNGATDFLMALSYIARNWSATLYVIALAMVGFFVAVQAVLYGYFDTYGLWGSYANYGASGALSPLLIIPIALALLSMGIGVGYWMTEGMRYDPASDARARRDFWRTWIVVAIAFAISVYFLITPDMALVKWIYGWLRPFVPFMPDVQSQFVPVSSMPAMANALFWAGAAILGMAAGSSLLAFIIDGRKDNPTSPVRRRLTRWSTVLNHAALWCAAIAAIDTVALKLRADQLGWSPTDGLGGLWTLAIYPAIAFLIKKLPEWFSGGKGGISGWIGKHARSVAVLGGCLLYASLAVFADLAVHMALWTGPAWSAAMAADGATFVLFAIIVAALVVMTGVSSGFANLSSLHALYTSRLTRAYLGASNRDRMRKTIEISDGHPKDFIDAQLYSEADLPAPMHLINLTLNQTRGANQLVRRDRKGQRFTVGPDGICVDGAPNAWSALNEEGAERFSVGQLAAISGAAASSAMGRQTSLGAALGLTFANVRLGYWWDRGQKRLVTGDEGNAPQPPAIWYRPFETFIYLFNEMTSRFSLDYRHYYLSDGGHSENSGALELLRRRCKFMLVCDNGQDENFLFADLEIFIRTARIDLGFEIHECNEDDTVEYVGQRAARHFFNTVDGDWRAQARESGGRQFALLLSARLICDKKPGGSGDDDDDFTAYIVWVKPRIFAGISTDIASYATQNPPFPHQTTIDQFFDEAQWESYRRLGYEMASCLFADEQAFDDVPVIRLSAMARDFYGRDC
jgi:hypothetical protein